MKSRNIWVLVDAQNDNLFCCFDEDGRESVWLEEAFSSNVMIFYSEKEAIDNRNAWNLQECESEWMGNNPEKGDKWLPPGWDWDRDGEVEGHQLLGPYKVVKLTLSAEG